MQKIGEAMYANSANGSGQAEGEDVTEGEAKVD
jgi:hypothetical protein